MVEPSDIFGRCLPYLIRDTIRSGNVLGFSVEAILILFKNKSLKAEDNSMVEAIDTEEVWLADKRVELVTRHIINNHGEVNIHVIVNIRSIFYSPKYSTQLIKYCMEPI